ncbi:MAG TPA: Gfo/Idh/MocA family oxidoreductase, partial [Candidatus Sulfotelmatobacter sp.]|nr:Gfo/Idh/MocA family oxidoreductase [Candidatus Sulfotelmatobacter sp.]
PKTGEKWGTPQEPTFPKTWEKWGTRHPGFAGTIWFRQPAPARIFLAAHNPISVAVVGVGVFGRNHARVYKELELQGEKVRLLGVVDPDTARADAVAREFGCKAFGSVQQLLTTHSEVQAASVAAPTMHHLPVARELMKAGVDVLIEKPVATSLDEADELVSVAKQHHRIAQAGHLERFNPAVRATLPILTRPMFFEVHRLSVFTPRSLDIDVVLDLMIHDLDIVLALARSPVKEVRAVGLPILSGKVDIANVRLEFESGCIANFTASRVSTERVRKLRFFQPRQYVSLDYGRQEVLVFTVGPDGASTPSVNPQIGVSKPPVASEEPLHAELRSFVQAVRERSDPIVPLEDGRRALALALEIVGAIREHGKKVGLAAISHTKH